MSDLETNGPEVPVTGSPLTSTKQKRGPLAECTELWLDFYPSTDGNIGYSYRVIRKPNRTYQI